MTSEIVLTNARIVTRTEVFVGSAALRDGRIAEVSRGVSGLPGAVDLTGDLLLPGLVDLHTDNFERAIEPRTGARLPASPPWPRMIGKPPRPV